MKTRMFICLLAWVALLPLRAQTSDLFAVKNPDKIYLGALVAKASINEDNHRMADVQLAPIRAVVGNSKSVEMTPSYENMRQQIRSYVAEYGLPKAQENLSLSIYEPASYQALNLLFGQEIPTSLYFGTDKKTRRTLVAISIKQTYCTLTMDIPDSPDAYCPDKEVLAHASEWAYVHSLDFGRWAVVLVASNSSPEDVRMAINTVLQEDTQEIPTVLANATVSVVLPGGEEMALEDAMVHPLLAVKNYMQQEVTEKDLLRPIEFRAAGLDDNSMFVNQFRVE